MQRLPSRPSICADVRTRREQIPKCTQDTEFAYHSRTKLLNLKNGFGQNEASRRSHPVVA